MSLFDKIFGSKVTADRTAEKSAVEPQQEQGDFIFALSIQLRGELEPALATYLKISEAFPRDTLAPFFAASIMAQQGNAVGAAENLRTLSRSIAAEGDTISNAIALELFAQVGDEQVKISAPAVAEILTTFGDLLKKAGFLQESAVVYEIAAVLVPDNGNVLHKLGDTLHDLRNYEYAESVLLEALKFAPNHWGALYSYAVLLQDLGRGEEAIRYYSRAVTLNPTHVNCHNNYGAALLRMNRLDEALVQCSDAAQLDPGSPFVKINLGNIHLLRHEYKKAQACFAEAIALNATLAAGYFGLATVEQALESDPVQIRELYLKAIEIDPAIVEAHHALGNLLAKSNDPEALKYFSFAALLNNNLKNLHRDFGTAFWQLGRRKEALEHLRTALEQAPDDVTVQDALARMEAENPA
jgi:tetratricopeptide (TPR) repeat protein